MDCYTFSKITQKNETEKWIQDRMEKLGGEFVFATFSFKNQTSQENANKFFTTFHHGLSKKIFKNAYSKKKKMIELFAVSEGNNFSTRRHNHAIIQIPYKENQVSFFDKVKNYWPHGNVDFIKVTNKNEAVGYLLKLRTKPSELDILTHF